MARTATSPVAPIYERPWLYPEQLEAIFCPERYGVIEASTKAGKTAGCMVWLTEQALQGQANYNYWWVAPVLSQSRMVFDRLRAILPREIHSINESVPFIRLANQTRIWFKGGDNPDTLYGDDVYAAVIDEASRFKETAWYAVRSTLTATRGPIRIIGNVKGRRNWAYKLARRAESGSDPSMHYAKITATDAVRAGVLAADEIEDARGKYPPAIFRELFFAEPNDDEGNPFDLEAIRACVQDLSDRVPVVWGWDLAKKQDWCVGIALDERGEVCRLVRFQKPWRETISTIQRETGDTLAVVDATGVGDPIVEALQRSTRIVTDAKGQPETIPAIGNFEGFVFSAKSKQQLMEGLMVAIQRRDIRFPAGIIQTELEAFEYVYERTGVRYSAPPGMTDDCVMALALALSRWQRTDRHVEDDWLRLFKAGEQKATGIDRDTGQIEYGGEESDDDGYERFPRF